MRIKAKRIRSSGIQKGNQRKLRARRPSWRRPKRARFFITCGMRGKKTNRRKKMKIRLGWIPKSVRRRYPWIRKRAMRDKKTAKNWLSFMTCINLSLPATNGLSSKIIKEKVFLDFSFVLTYSLL
jgi:hypothetical protein